MFARALNREALVDEYRLMESRPFATGAVESTYRPR